MSVDFSDDELEAARAEAGLKPRGLRVVAPGERGEDWQTHLLFNDTKGKAPKLAKHHANAVAVLRYHPAWKGKIYFDEHAQVTRVSSPPWHEPEQAPSSADEEGFREWTDADDGRLSSWLAREPNIRLELSSSACAEAVRIVAEGNPRHPFREWLDSLRWDGKERLNSALFDYFGVTPGEYASNVFRWWMISLCARTYWPGCKADYVLILEGGQGINKSTALRVLAVKKAWFSDTPIRLDSKDRFQALLGKVIVEMAEFKLDSKAAKDFFTSSVDNYRPPFGRREVSVARRGGISATMNPPSDGAYLTDETGARRYWPVTCGEIDLRGIERVREQLWAEAAYVCQESLICPECSPTDTLIRCEMHRWWPVGAEHAELAEEQEQRTEQEPWQEAIGDWLSTRPGDVSLNEVILGALKFDNAGKIDRNAQRRASRAMKGLGYRRVQLGPDANGRRPWVYRKG